jgi:HEAT repeat protein
VGWGVAKGDSIVLLIGCNNKMAEYQFDDMLRYLKGRGKFDSDIRVDAIELISEMADPRVRDALEAILADDEEYLEVHEAAKDALQRLGP